MTLGRALTVMPMRAMATQVSKPAGSASTDFREPSKGGVGFKPDPYARDIYLNPLVSPPPRGPRSPEDFANPSRLGNWFPLGFDYYDPVRDKFCFHELMFGFFTLGVFACWWFSYAPDYKQREWSRREAFLRTAKREALGLPLIDPNVVDPDRIVLPTEEELADLEIEITQ